MSTNPYSTPAVAAAQATPDVRRRFIQRTYLHLAFAILAFIVVEFLLLRSPLARPIIDLMFGMRYSWLIVLAAFMGIATLAQNWARSNTSIGKQYLGLGLYVVAEAVIFLPLLYMAANAAGSSVLPVSGLVTLLLFAGLTFTAFTSGVDFSFLRSALVVGGFVALGIIIASILFGFNLGVIFAGFMVLFAGAAILYQTSNVIRDYRTDQHVAASLALFASVALLFWYIVTIFSNRD